MSKLSKFRETFSNDFTEYLLQVPLFIMTTIIYSLFFGSSDKKIIEIFSDIAIINLQNTNFTPPQKADSP